MMFYKMTIRAISFACLIFILSNSNVIAEDNGDNIGPKPPNLIAASLNLLNYRGEQQIDVIDDMIIYSTKNNLWNNHVFSEENASNGMANAIMGFRDTVLTAILSTNEGADHYTHFRGNIWNANYWYLIASADVEGYVSKIEFQNTKREKFIAGDINDNHKVDYFGMPIDTIYWGILFKDSNESKFETIAIFNANVNEYVAFGPLLKESLLKSQTFIRNNLGNWTEYIYDVESGKLVTVGIHDSIPGNLTYALYDITLDGTADAIIQVSENGDNYEIGNASDSISLTSFESHSLSNLLNSTSKICLENWDQMKDVIDGFEAIGNRLPKVIKMPEQ